MKAVVCRRYGPPEVLQIVDRPRPVPGPNGLLIRVCATTVSSADWRVRALQMPPGFAALGRIAFGLRRPRQPILGTELSGVVAAVGSRVTRFAVGDAVFAFPGARMGCHAEYACVAADGPVALKPANLSHEQAAALCFGGATVLDFFRRGALRSGERVLVNGASGTVGTAAVQLAKHAGAHVTGVCGTAHLDAVRAIGADRVIDHTRADFTRLGHRYDLIVDAAGTAPYARSAPVLARGGRLLLVLAGLAPMVQALWAGRRSQHTVIAGPVAERIEDVHTLARLAAAGAFTPVLDRCYPLHAVQAAHRHVDGGHKLGSVVLQMDAGTGPGAAALGPLQD